MKLATVGIAKSKVDNSFLFGETYLNLDKKELNFYRYCDKLLISNKLNIRKHFWDNIYIFFFIDKYIFDGMLNDFEWRTFFPTNQILNSIK